MPRPKSRRLIYNPPLYRGFKPLGVKGRDLSDLEMSLDEFEALRLADYEGLSQEDAALEMAISRSTFSRLIESARRKSSQFLIQGRRLLIGGGPVHFKKNLFRCSDCGALTSVGMGTSPSVCRCCGSDRLEDLAGDFGHGECCRASD